jgi:dTDP-4-amino-4,6-dideoxygalactose transaminase
MELPPAIGARPASSPPRRSGRWHSVTSGRTALALVARAVTLARRAGPALVPGYVCSAVVNALRAGGLEVRYYPVAGDLTVDPAVLVRAVERHQPALVLVIHYFGFPVSPAVFDALAPFRDRCWLVEDCAHGSWLEADSAPCGAHGDFVLTSFRKYLPVPDGGWLLNRTGVALPSLRPAETEFVGLRLAAKIIKHEFGAGRLGPAAESVYLELFAAAERQVDARVPMLAMSTPSQDLLASYDLRAILNRRHRNFSRALERLRQAPIAPVAAPIFQRLPRGVSPMLMPLRVPNGVRDRLRSALAARRVFCPVHWKLPVDVRGRQFDEAKLLSREMLGLPIDQRYGDRDIDELLRRVAAACREVGQAG